MPAGESNLTQTSTIMRFVPAANLLGLPAISLPAGRDSASGLPVGLQLLGRPLDDALLIRQVRASRAVFGDRLGWSNEAQNSCQCDVAVCLCASPETL